jgi:hypothetical protein
VNFSFFEFVSYPSHVPDKFGSRAELFPEMLNMNIYVSVEDHLIVSPEVLENLFP